MGCLLSKPAKTVEPELPLETQKIEPITSAISVSGQIAQQINHDPKVHPISDVSVSSAVAPESSKSTDKTSQDIATITIVSSDEKSTAATTESVYDTLRARLEAPPSMDPLNTQSSNPGMVFDALLAKLQAPPSLDPLAIADKGVQLSHTGLAEPVETHEVGSPGKMEDASNTSESPKQSTLSNSEESPASGDSDTFEVDKPTVPSWAPSELAQDTQAGAEIADEEVEKSTDLIPIDRNQVIQQMTQPTEDVRLADPPAPVQVYEVGSPAEMEDASNKSDSPNYYSPELSNSNGEEVGTQEPFEVDNFAMPSWAPKEIKAEAPLLPVAATEFSSKESPIDREIVFHQLKQSSSVELLVKKVEREGISAAAHSTASLSTATETEDRTPKNMQNDTAMVNGSVTDSEVTVKALELKADGDTSNSVPSDVVTTSAVIDPEASTTSRSEAEDPISLENVLRSSLEAISHSQEQLAAEVSALAEPYHPVEDSTLLIRKFSHTTMSSASLTPAETPAEVDGNAKVSDAIVEETQMCTETIDVEVVAEVELFTAPQFEQEMAKAPTPVAASVHSIVPAQVPSDTTNSSAPTMVEPTDPSDLPAEVIEDSQAASAPPKLPKTSAWTVENVRSVDESTAPAPVELLTEEDA